MKVTIKKIAELAGVSTGTVDRALHNRGRVNPAVAKRIKEIAAELDYQPNIVAKSLAIRKHNLKIAVIFHIRSHNAFFDDVTEGITRCKEEISDFGIEIKIHYCSDFDGQEQVRLIDQAVADGANAIAIVPINSDLVRERINTLHQNHFPVVFLTNIIEDADYLSFVGCNYRLSGQLAAGFLHHIHSDKGNILFFSPSFHMYGHILRRDGLKKQLAEHYQHLSLDGIYELTGDSIKDYHITLNALKAFPDTDLIVCPGAYSRGNLQAIEDGGYCHNAKIVCYDYSEEVKEKMEQGTITAALFQQPKEQGYLAIRTLFHYLTADKYPSVKNQYIQTQIIIKENLSET